MLVTQKHEALVYDGTNGAHIAGEWLDDTTLLDDDGQVLRIEVAGWPAQQHEIPAGSYVIRYYGKTFREALPPDEFAERWAEVPEPPAPASA
ncbi:hypothetical protein AMK26_10315 [Streptomyces sp. CB03234]|uniref:hypothetical protein n=1 Tax=Streptomyces sp. (strain CB03234) TaxID=1703937 RepID=UPI00093F337C|nr:hypothetical protein [Streptomyces sp. CB03234]OKK06411.1 hypothetical protein AMK26_10315 [Streptomyces sp. CB03234]